MPLSLFYAFKIFFTQEDKTKKYDLVKLIDRNVTGLEENWAVFIYKQMLKN